MKLTYKWIPRLAEIVMEGGAKSAIKVVSPSLVVKVTTRGRLDHRCKSHNFILTIGAPNYKERQFIQQCEAAGELFPVKKPRIKWYRASK